MTKEVKEKKPKLFIILRILTVIAVIASVFAIYELYLLSSIETVARYIIMGVLVLLDIFMILKTKRITHNKKKKKDKNDKKESKRIGYVIFLVLYSIICIAVGGVIYYVYGQVSSINKVYVTYTSDLIAMATNEADDIKDVKDMTIGILKNKEDPEGYIIPMEVIDEENLEDENTIKKFDDYSTMLADLYEGKLDAIFISDSGRLSLGYENIETETKIIYAKDKKMKKASTSSIESESSGKSINEPFTILLMGIDSTDEVLQKNAVANGDTLILITFNPKTLNATMVSIPRDSYVPIACWSDKAENKITHAAAYGNDCMMNTIEEYTGINIDYYAKINFKGLVKLVDAVGGVEVEVPQELCTDDSSRGSQVCIQPGVQVLNGEQALVFARNRKSLANGDFGRAQHQQEIVMALVNKMKEITDVGTFTKILNTISNSLDTNLTTQQILSFYNVGKDIVKKSLSADEADLVNIQQLYLQGTGQMIYDERMRMVLWDYIPNKDSKKDIIQAMKENLEIAEHKDIKEFSFSINEPYEKEVVGYGPYKSQFTYTLLPDFTGDSESAARSYASRAGISVTFKGSGGYVVSQSYPASKRIDKISGSVVLTLSGSGSSEKTESTTTTKKDDDDDDDKTSTSTGTGTTTPGTSTPPASGDGGSGSEGGSGEDTGNVTE